MSRLVLFDFDGTLTSQDTAKYLVAALVRNRPWKVFRVFFFVIWAVLVRNSPDRIQALKNKCFSYLLAGMGDDSLKVALERFSGNVRPLLREGVMRRLIDATRDGAVVLIVTASPDFAIRYCLANFSVHVIGTQFRRSNGVFVGDVDGTPCYGEAKVGKVLAWQSEQSSALRVVEAWSDSLSDLAMMRMADKRFWVVSESVIDDVKSADQEGSIFLV